MKSTGLATRLRRVLAHIPPRLAGAAVSVLALAASLLVTASPAGAATAGFTSPVVWNGTDLVTAVISRGYELYAYEQQPGAASWGSQLVADISPEGEPFIGASIAATSNATEIVAQDVTGNIYFYQQIDGGTNWQTGVLVGSVPNPEFAQTDPQIAWTGVPGHTGTNSVIATTDGNGNILYWYQTSSGGWAGPQTVASASSAGPYSYSAVTATSKGIVVAAVGEDNFQSFFQAYGSPPPWQSDGSVGAGPSQSFGSVSVTWDGTNVDVAATENLAPGGTNADALMFLWKPGSGAWNQKAISNSPAADAFGVPDITYTGSNLLITDGQQLSSSQQRLDFWWQGSTVTKFNFESVSKPVLPDAIGPPQIAYTDGASSPEAVITNPYTNNDGSTWGVRDWTEPFGSSTWTKHTVTAP